MLLPNSGSSRNVPFMQKRLLPEKFDAEADR